MAIDEKRLDILEEELTLLKAEMKRTLIDIRAFIMREDSPLNERMSLSAAGTTTERIITKEIVEDKGKVQALEQELRSLKGDGSGGPPPPPPPPPQ